MLLRARYGRVQLDQIGDSKWAICNVLRHVMCSDGHYARVQMAGGSWDKRRSELALSQCRDGKDGGVQVVWIMRSFGDLTRNGCGIDMQQRRGDLGKASPSILDGSSKSIGSGELPRAVTG